MRAGILWIQEKVEEGEINVRKVPGGDNLADLLTKNVNAATNEKYMNIIGEQHKDGRAEVSTEPK